MNIAIYGLGLIGGSLGKAISSKTSHKVFGYDICSQTIKKAQMANAISEVVNDENLKNMDMIVLAISPSAAIKTMKNIVPKLKNGAIVIDCCGNKRKVVAAMQEQLREYPKLNFVGAHPMTGKEVNGIENACADLFCDSYAILVPVDTAVKKLAIVKQLFVDVGCRDTEITTADFHDKMIAYTSQLAHIVSSSYIKNPLSNKHVGFSAGSFKDMTRVAKLNSDMWTELLMENRDNIIEEIAQLQTHLDEFKCALQNGDSILLDTLLNDGVKMKQSAENNVKETK